MKEDKIKCMECKEYYKEITNTHLKKCSGLTVLQYKIKYPNIEITNEECKGNISIGQKESYKNGRKIPPMKGRKHSDISKQKQRLSRIKEIEEKHGIACPNYNLKACKFFDKLNKYMNWNGYHAENGGEYSILGYFLDYYEPELNIVIEYDEKSHKYQEQKDIIRQEEIEKFLNCNFIRIKESDFKDFNKILEYIQKIEL